MRHDVGIMLQHASPQERAARYRDPRGHRPPDPALARSRRDAAQRRGPGRPARRHRRLFDLPGRRGRRDARAARQPRPREEGRREGQHEDRRGADRPGRARAAHRRGARAAGAPAVPLLQGDGRGALPQLLRRPAARSRRAGRRARAADARAARFHRRGDQRALLDRLPGGRDRGERPPAGHGAGAPRTRRAATPGSSNGCAAAAAPARTPGRGRRREQLLRGVGTSPGFVLGAGEPDGRAPAPVAEPPVDAPADPTGELARSRKPSRRRASRPSCSSSRSPAASPRPTPASSTRT